MAPGESRRVVYDIPRMGVPLPEPAGDNLLWITGGSPGIGQIDADGAVRRVFSFTPDELTPSRLHPNDTTWVHLTAAQAEPFIDGRKLGQALADAQGNVFLQTWPSDRYVFLKAPF
ncbi:MAG TPA: hypothetical protein VNF74_08760 [Terriglobales bacterium]|nr:hypothetical protein [Terriglobales bacterium]